MNPAQRFLPLLTYEVISLGGADTPRPADDHFKGGTFGNSACNKLKSERAQALPP